MTTGMAEHGAEVDDRTAPVRFDTPVAGNGTVTAANQPDAGRRHDRESVHPQSGLWRALRTKPLRAFLLALLVAIGAGVAGWHLNSKGTPVYASQTVMIVNQPYGIATAGDEGILVKLVAVRAKYQGLATTDVMAQPVAAKLGLPVDKVLSAITVTVPPDSLLLTVTATWTSAHEAQRLSSAMAAEISNYVDDENVQYKVPPADQFNIRTVDPTTVATLSTPSHRKSVVDAIGLALVAFIICFAGFQLIFNRKLLTA
jgi:capsular polysaccharide biosynthesis protein